MGILNGGLTTWSLSGGQLWTSLGTTSILGAIYAIDTDKDGNKFVNPRKLAKLTSTSIGSTAISSLINLSQVFAEEYKDQASALGVSAAQEEAVNDSRYVEEWFESLPDEAQAKFLARIDEKTQALQNSEPKENVFTKHL